MGKLESIFHRVRKLRAIKCLANTYAGTKVNRLDNNRITDLGFHLINKLFRCFQIAAVFCPQTVKHRQASFLPDAFHHIFVHSQRRRQHVASDKRNTQRLKITLQCAIFNVGPMNNREDNVDCFLNVVAQLFKRIMQQLHPAVRRNHQHLLALFEQLRDTIAIAFDFANFFTDIKLIFLGHIDRHNVIFGPVQIGCCLKSRDNRHFMFDALSAKQYAQFYFHKSTLLSSDLCAVDRLSVLKAIRSYPGGHFPAGRSSVHHRYGDSQLI